MVKKAGKRITINKTTRSTIKKIKPNHRINPGINHKLKTEVNKKKIHPVFLKAFEYFKNDFEITHFAYFIIIVGIGLFAQFNADDIGLKADTVGFATDLLNDNLNEHDVVLSCVDKECPEKMACLADVCFNKEMYDRFTSLNDEEQLQYIKILQNKAK